MIRTDIGAGAASARHSVSSTTPGQSTRRESSAASGGDPFGDLMDRYSDDSPETRSHAASPHARTQAGTPAPKQPERPAGRHPKVSEGAAPAGRPQVDKRRVFGDADGQGEPRVGRAAKDEDVDADAVFTAAAPLPVSATVVTGDHGSQGAKSAQAPSGLIETAGSQPAGSGVSAGIAEGQEANALADRAENALAELADAVQTSESSNGEGTADGLMPAVHGQAANRPADPAGDARQVAIDALRSALASDAAKTAAGKPADVETVQADAAPAKAGGATAASADKRVGTDRGPASAARHATQAAGQDGTATASVLADAGDRAGRSAGQSPNGTTDDRHSVLADASTSRTESSSSRGPRPHGSGKQVANAPQESGATAHRPTSFVAPGEATHTQAKQEGETSVAPKPTVTAAQAIAAFQVASMANTTTAAASHPQVGAPSTAPSTLLDAELPTQIIHAIRVQVEGGTSEARVQLNPGFLGSVSVGVRMEAGSVVASLQASDPQVREWMRTNEPMLRQALADQGLQLERLVIVEDDTQPPGSGREESQEQQQQQPPPRPRRRPSTEGTFELVL